MWFFFHSYAINLAHICMFQAGQQFGPYTLIRPLGRGGFGEVWLAERRTKFATTEVAVKLPLDEQGDHAAIKQEAQLWARANGHINVLGFIEADKYDGQILIVSEYASDGSLNDLLRRNGGALPLRQAVEMTIGILKGLEFLHSRQIIHRDLKPANILLQGETPRLADFGLSRVLKSSSYSASVAGTPGYMAPEAFDGKRTVQTDVWSVGVMLYQMLKGELPFTGNYLSDLFGAIRLTEPEPLPDSIPTLLRATVWQALTKEVTGRYRTAQTMRDGLEEFLLNEPWPRPAPPVVVPAPVVKPLDEPATLTIPVSPPEIGKPSLEVKRPAPAEIRKPISLTKQSFPVWLGDWLQTSAIARYFLVVVLILTAFSAIYWLKPWRILNPTAGNPISESSATDTTLHPYFSDNKWGYSDANNKIVIDPQYDLADQFVDGLARVRLDGKWGFIDPDNHRVIKLQYEDAKGFNEGFARVMLGDRFGFINMAGTRITQIKYDAADSFSGGMARVKLGKQWGFVDTTGKEAIPLLYDDVDSFRGGRAKVKLGRYTYYIDKNQNQYYEPAK